MPTPPGPINKQKVNKAITSFFDREWQTLYENLDKHRVSKLMMPKVTRKNAKYLLTLSKNQIRDLAQYTTGRGHFKGWYYTLYEDPKIDPTCSLCEVGGSVEEPNHLWYECSMLLTRPRDGEGNTPEPTLETILDTFYNSRIKQLVLDQNKSWLLKYLEEQKTDTKAGS